MFASVEIIKSKPNSEISYLPSNKGHPTMYGTLIPNKVHLSYD